MRQSLNSNNSNVLQYSFVAVPNNNVSGTSGIDNNSTHLRGNVKGKKNEYRSRA